MENQEIKEEKKTCSCKQDAKTFLIALLTAVIVVAIYHFGCGLFKIYCADSCGEGFPVCQRYVLVPVQTLPPCGGCPDMDAPRPPRHHGEFRGKRKMEHRGMENQGKKPMDFKRPEMPDKPAPEQK